MTLSPSQLVARGVAYGSPAEGDRRGRDSGSGERERGSSGPDPRPERADRSGPDRIERPERPDRSGRH